jgi:peptidoglycan hydrolase-like protein with peptidoglycan-binding domain
VQRRISTIVFLAVLAAVVAGAAVAAVGFGGRGSGTATARVLTPATANVTRGTLTQTTRVSGTLNYGGVTTLTARGQAGTVTWLPATGAVIGRGHQAYKVDDRTVPLLYGTLPLYRALHTGLSGADVKELETNLRALGYTGFTVDERYSTATAAAVKAWQSDLDLPETGAVGVDQVVFAPGALRVTELKASVGGPATGPVLAFTGTTRVVEVPLDVSLQSLVKPGITATVTLPDGTAVSGTVSTVGTVATTGTREADNESTATIDVTIRVPDQRPLGTLDSAPVSVTLVSERAEDVLSVPVAALVALAEGGYGVQVVEGTTTRYVAVRTGMFANGRVEISGDGIAEGTTVGVPR